MDRPSYGHRKALFEPLRYPAISISKRLRTCGALPVRRSTTGQSGFGTQTRGSNRSWAIIAEGIRDATMSGASRRLSATAGSANHQHLTNGQRVFWTRLVILASIKWRCSSATLIFVNHRYNCRTTEEFGTPLSDRLGPPEHQR